MTNAGSTLVHATCVAVHGCGVLIRGQSGVGKSALGIKLIALGARLVADDQTLLTREGDQIIARCPAALFGLIEARGIGILRSDPLIQAPVNLIVDLDTLNDQRLPPPRRCDLLGVEIDLVHRIAGDHFPYSLMCFLPLGRHA
jgi:HPr kinase/phosphorylase